MNSYILMRKYRNRFFQYSNNIDFTQNCLCLHFRKITGFNVSIYIAKRPKECHSMYKK